MADKKKIPQKRPAVPAGKPTAPPPEPLAAPPEPVVAEEGPFFRAIDWSAFWVATIVTLIVYVWTLAPTLTLEDSGELATAGAYLGVPHPPGYPIWTVIVWVFTKVFAFVRYNGQPNPAWSIGLASAVFGALASGVSALLICRSGRDILRSVQRATEVIGERTEGLICWAGGISCSLIFAFDPIVWSQSVIVEVYALNAFFLVLVMLLAYMWIRRPQPKYLYWTAFLFGLGMTNYQVLLLLIVSLLVLIVAKDLALFRDFVIISVPYGVVVGLIQAGVLPPIIHPTHITCFVYMGLNFFGLALAYFLLPRGREVALTILFVELGLSVYAFMPIASEFNPPMNWGYPRTWDGFKHALTRGQYEKIVPTSMFSVVFIHQVGEYLRDLRSQFTLPIAILGFLPFAAWRVKLGGRRIRAMLIAVIMVVVASAMVLLEEYLTSTGEEIGVLSASYRLLILGVLMILAIGGVALLLSEVRELLAKATGRLNVSVSDRIMAGLVLAGAAGVVLAYLFMLGQQLMAPVPPGFPPRSAGESVGIVFFMVGPLVVGALIAWLMAGRTQLEWEIDRNAQKWIIATLCGFLVMSVLLIALAAPKGDLQDMFIQRVKFISSHALYAFWIGYGIIFGLALVDTVSRGNKVIAWIGLCGTLLLPAIPILENAYNKELIRTMGGAEQNGHDFGWQFGNYQLRGARAVTEELKPGEEPLPNPEYPDEMGYRAVFFGGTDPGRFVPTYMIFCARVRPDVFLITQNALADNTYMSVMRDLYGNDIWIPSIRDGNSAFQKYVEDVNAGRMPASAEIQIKDGRVSVQGVGGVMLINGILAKMIFDYNIWRHDFYVEESYVIQWMYPYLEPHGLIMKINANPLPQLSPERVTDDMDFWDWYTRRLVGNQKFIRDVVARKSFSKLRSAIAGVYVFRGLFEQSERAFKEALALYPLSPEANFRLADLYLRWGKGAEACALMEDFIRQDPGNDRSIDFLRDIRNRDKLVVRKTELETELSKGQAVNIAMALELADIYRKLGDDQRFMGVAVNILGQPGMPPQVYMTLYQMFSESRKIDQAAQALEKYLERVPSDMNGWVDMAALRIAQQKPNELIKALQTATRIGGEAAVERLRTDTRFDPIRQTPAFRQLVGEG